MAVSTNISEPSTKRSDYSSVTEVPGLRAHRGQLSAIHTRYHFAAQFCEGKDVLEVACGAGFGLGYLARTARRVVGGDIDENNLTYARRACEDIDNVEVLRLDAEELPLDDDTFDTLLICEAIYYLPDVERFFAECRRVLRPGGRLVVVTVNCQWEGFNRSPHSTYYLPLDELERRLRSAGFAPESWLGFRSEKRSLPRKTIGWLRRLAVKLRLIPRTMHGKQWLKRLVFGKLAAIQPTLTPESAPLEPLHEADSVADALSDFAVIYAVGQLYFDTETLRNES